jgi:hypothetical protein
MKKSLLIIYRWLVQLGIDFRKSFYSVKSIIPFFRNYVALLKSSQDSWPIEISQPCLTDRFDFAGTIDRQYFYQDTYVASKIFKANPVKHFDIGSRIDGFIAQISIFRQVTILDIRPLNISIENVFFKQANICDPNFSISEVDSVSCLHTIEHFGLGRYGDPIGVNLWEIGVDNIWKCVAKGGKLYISTPIGKQRIIYNAHRIFKPSTLLNRFDFGTIIEFAHVDDQGNFHKNGPLNISDIDQLASKYNYGLGIFTIVKN